MVPKNEWSKDWKGRGPHWPVLYFSLTKTSHEVVTIITPPDMEGIRNHVGSSLGIHMLPGLKYLYLSA